MSDKVKAIVIKSNDRKEKDSSVLLFSLEKGKIWVTLKGIKSQNSKMKLAQRMFCFGEFVLEEGKSGQIVTSFNCLESFFEIAEDVDKYFEASAILEVVEKLNFSSDFERVKVFMLLLNALKNICFGNLKPKYAIDKFFVELFAIYGFPMYSSKCSVCGTNAFDKLYVNYATGELVCTGCKTFISDELSKPIYLALKIFSNTDFEKLSTVRLSPNSEKKLLKILVKNFEIRFDESLKCIGMFE